MAKALSPEISKNDNSQCAKRFYARRLQDNLRQMAKVVTIRAATELT